MALPRAYYLLPPFLQSAVASLHGFRLQRMRYDAGTGALVKEAHEREFWSEAQWTAWRDAKLNAVLRRAREQVPYYRDYWNGRSGWEDLSNWPLLEKTELRRDPRRFLAGDCDPAKMYPERTSGSSGTPLTLWWSYETVRQWYAMFEARWRNWYGVRRHDRWAILGGQLVAPIERRKPPYWVWNAGMNQLYLSSYHMSADAIPAYLDEIERREVRYLFGYSSALATLAAGAIRSGRKPAGLRVAITNAEPVHQYQKQLVQEAFGCPLRETYGMAEIVAAASECEAGRLHLWPEAGLLESHGGELVATGLFNTDMPLIRYRLGDRGILEPPGTTCPCGRTLPLLAGLEGRVDQVLRGMNGQEVGRMDPVFKADLPLLEAQIIQTALDRIVLRYVPAPGFGPQTRDTLTREIQARLGPVTVEFEPMESIPREANGKFRAVLCKIGTGQ